MKKEVPDLFWWAVFLLASFIALIIFLISLVLFGIESVQSLLKEYSGILTGIIAVVVAFFTIRKQTQNVNRQIKTQISIAEKNRFLDKKEEVVVALHKIREVRTSVIVDIKRGTSKTSIDEAMFVLNDFNLLVFYIRDYKFPLEINSLVLYLNVISLLVNMLLDTSETGKDFFSNLDSLVEKNNDDEVFLELATQLNLLKNSSNINSWNEYKKEAVELLELIGGSYGNDISKKILFSNPILME